MVVKKTASPAWNGYYLARKPRLSDALENVTEDLHPVGGGQLVLPIGSFPYSHWERPRYQGIGTHLGEDGHVVLALFTLNVKVSITDIVARPDNW